MKKLFFVFIMLINSITVYASYTNKTVSMKLYYNNKSYDYKAERVILEIDGQELDGLSIPPIILNGYTLVPAREVFEKIGANVEWVSDIGQVYIKYNNNLVIIELDSQNAYVNGKKVKMDTEAKIINNKTMIPFRFVSEAFGFDVSWDNSTRTINIVTEKGLTLVHESFDDYKLVDENNKAVAEYSYIGDIGCDVYYIIDENNKTGLLDKYGKTIISPKYNDISIIPYAVNNIVTFMDNNTFYIYDTKGNLKKTVDCPLGYELKYPGYNEKYSKRYDIRGISGSNVIVSEHLGDMVIEDTPKQEFFIIRLFSEKKAAEDYYHIKPLPNGEFLAMDRKTNLAVFLNLDGSLKQTTDKYLKSFEGLIYRKYYIVYYEGIDNYNSDELCDVMDVYGNVIAEKVRREDIVVDRVKGKMTITDGDKQIVIEFE